MTDRELVKTEFEFGWEKWGRIPPKYAKPTLKHQKGDILDIGCATCELYTYLKKNGWNGTYYGIDIKKYHDYKYPDGVNLIIGDAAEIEFPPVDTIILYNILEHLDDPLCLFNKALQNSKENVLINVPKRNEKLWEYGIVEYHQLDKTHKHCGFSAEEIYNMSEFVGGRVAEYKELIEIKPVFGVFLWDNIIPQYFMVILSRIFQALFSLIFSSKKFYNDIWCEVVKK